MKKSQPAKPINPNNYDSRRQVALAEMARKRAAEKKAAEAAKAQAAATPGETT